MDETDFLYINIHICGLCIFMFLGIYDIVTANPKQNAYNPIHYDFAILMAVINIMMILRICYNCVMLYKKQFHKSFFHIMIVCFVIIFILTYVGYSIQKTTGRYAHVYIIQYFASIAFVCIIKCCIFWNPFCYDRCVKSKKKVSPEIILPSINTRHLTTPNTFDSMEFC